MASASTWVGEPGLGQQRDDPAVHRRGFPAPAPGPRPSRGRARDGPSSRAISASEAITSSPFCSAASATTEASAAELESTASPFPAGSGWAATTWAISISSSLVRTRITPDWRSIASTARGGRLGGAHRVARGQAQAHDIGLGHDHRLGVREPAGDAGELARVAEGFQVQAHRARCRGRPPRTAWRRCPRHPPGSRPRRSRRPRRRGAPRPRRAARPMAADWLNSPSVPRLGMPGATEAFMEVAGSVFTRPREAGPITRMPLARARRTSSRWRASPASPSFSKPPVAISSPLTPAARAVGDDLVDPFLRARRSRPGRWVRGSRPRWRSWASRRARRPAGSPRRRCRCSRPR